MGLKIERIDIGHSIQAEKKIVKREMKQYGG